MNDKPSAVLLDVGGVFLLPSRSHIRSALQQVGHYVLDDAVIDRAHYLGVREFPMDLDDSEYLGPYWDAYLMTYARSVGVPDDRVEEAVEHLRNEYVTGWLWSLIISGAKEGLAELVGTGVPVGIVSNSDGSIERRLQEMAVLQVGPGQGVEVQCVVDSGTVGVEKPDPRIFDYALDQLGLPPDGIWYVGDTPAFDVVAAHKAGLLPLLMDPFHVNDDYGVDTVGSLSAVADLVVA
ncbi:MAG TPA: HAD family hydrolase [Acidimicrobiia bacterium]|nr:HAD family hydrolase [Acidimicrobiia bacterium]